MLRSLKAAEHFAVPDATGGKQCLVPQWNSPHSGCMKLMQHHGNVPVPSQRRELVLPAVSAKTLAIGAFSLGAVAMGAVAVGALAIGKASVGRADIKELYVGRLQVDELVVVESTGPEPGL